MRRKLMFAVVGLVLSGGVVAASYTYEVHRHTSDTFEVLGHGGGLDSRGGHNCSAKSKAKGLCSGYHRHR